MNNEDDYEIDYEDMDDLALCDHIEWNHDQSPFTLEALDYIYD